MRIPPTAVGGLFKSCLHATTRPLRIPPTAVGGWFKSSLHTTTRLIHQLLLRNQPGLISQSQQKADLDEDGKRPVAEQTVEELVAQRLNAPENQHSGMHHWPVAFPALS